MKNLPFLSLLLSFGIIVALVNFAPDNSGPQVSSTDGAYSFLSTGHIYGAPNLWASADPSARQQVFPAASLLSFTDQIDSLGADFLMLLGDNVLYGDSDSYEALETSFLNKLELPVFSIIGNHDRLNDLDGQADKRHEELFGPLYQSFKKGSEYYILLDTGDSNSSFMAEEQLDFLRKEIAEAKEDLDVLNVFIFTHKLVWTQNNEELHNIVYWFFPNYKNGIVGDSNLGELMPDILALAEEKNIYWGSGDIKDLYPAFYYFDENQNITYFATSLNDSQDDVMFRVNISETAEVSFETISLFDGNVVPASEFGEELWTSLRD